MEKAQPLGIKVCGFSCSVRTTFSQFIEMTLLKCKKKNLIFFFNLANAEPLVRCQKAYLDQQFDSLCQLRVLGVVCGDKLLNALSLWTSVC